MTNNSQGTMNVSGGTVTIDSGGMLTNNGQFWSTGVGGSPYNTTVTNSGTLTNSGSLWNGTIPPAYGFASNHTADMLDNTGTLNNFNLLENYGTLNNNSGGTLTSTGTLINNAILNNNTGGTLTNSVSGTLTNHGTVTNSGTVYDYGFINGAGTYTQTAGLIKVNGSLTQSSITINGGTLDGTGTITGPVAVGPGGTLQAGDAPGTLTIYGNLTSSGTLLFEIAGTASGKYSVLDVHSTSPGTGTVTFTGGTIEFDFISGYIPSPGNSWHLLFYNSLVGGNTVRLHGSRLGSRIRVSVQSPHRKPFGFICAPAPQPALPRPGPRGSCGIKEKVQEVGVIHPISRAGSEMILPFLFLLLSRLPLQREGLQEWGI